MRRVARAAATFLGLGALLFVTRFLFQGHLAPRTDQECHIGGIAVDLLAHGVRFPIASYSPNDYDNGTFFNGLLASLGFALFGRSLLVVKLVTHAFVTVGAVSTIVVLRRVLDELGWTDRRRRVLAVAVTVVSIALAPRIVAVTGMYGIGNHPEGAAIDAALLALFVRAHGGRVPWRIAARWALVGFALYVNKGTLIVLPALCWVELARARVDLGASSRVELARDGVLSAAAAAGGLVLGALPELLLVRAREGRGWARMLDKLEDGWAGFPDRLLNALVTSADRPELLVSWALALGVGAVLAWRGRSVALVAVALVSATHLLAFAVMAQGGFDAYVLYGYPPLSIFLGVLAVVTSDAVSARLPRAREEWVAAGVLGAFLLAHRPTSPRWTPDVVVALATEDAGSVCSWRFVEGFTREHAFGVAPSGMSRDEYVISRCRSLTDATQVADCIGGIGRELRWRRDGHVSGEPPAGLSDVERHSYAWQYGTHTDGDAANCVDFDAPELQETCGRAVVLECLAFADLYSRIETGRGIGRPRCALAEPPIDAFWASIRRELLARPDGEGPLREHSDLRDRDEANGCAAVFDACYPHGP